MIYQGWAFGVRPGQMTREQIIARYQEIKHLYRDFEWSSSPKYAHTKWTAKPKTDEARALSSMDVMILADHGNLCFGGDSSLRGVGDSAEFYGCYNTD